MKIILSTFAFILTACAAGPCPQQAHTGEKPPTVASATSTASDAPTKIRIFKADGSLQCEKAKTIELKTMEAELKKAGVTVLSSAKQPDGMMHPQVCGAPTGMANTFEINSSDLPKAQKIGFKKVED